MNSIQRGVERIGSLLKKANTYTETLVYMSKLNVIAQAIVPRTVSEMNIMENSMEIESRNTAHTVT